MVTAVMLAETLLVTPRHEAHATVSFVHVLERNPEMKGFQRVAVSGIGLVLMPRGFRIVERLFVDGMVVGIPRRTW